MMTRMTAPPLFGTIQIPGMRILSEIGRGAHSIVYRATRGDQTFAVKVRDETVSNHVIDVLPRFRREAAVLACLRHPGLPTIVEAGEVAGQPYLVMEYVDGQSLSEQLEDGPLAEARIVGLAMVLAGALAEVHRHGLVHRDVKPANVLLDSVGGVRLIDFGFAARISAARTEGDIVGTLRYCAPEQTGLLKRPVDGRADLYALGVVLFECATGMPPFTAVDAGELIRQHAVVPAANVRDLNPAISPALAALIAKLLAKDPDDRYQTGVGLMVDLERLVILNGALRAGQEIVLGISDDQAEIQYAAPLVGREAELAQLQKCWDIAKRGRGAVALVAGEPGSGKSRLIRELILGARNVGALVLRGKCVADARPFVALCGALEGYLRHIRRLPAALRHPAEQHVRAAAGEFSPLLRRFTPSLAALLDELPDPAETEHGLDFFYDVVADFLLRLPTADTPALIYLDDVQWLDDASRQVLRRIAGQVGKRPMLVVCTARSDSESAVHLEHFVADMGEALAPRLHLARLDEASVARLVAAHLGGRPLDRDVVRRIVMRGHGNPFAVGEYVQAMLDAGLLRPTGGGWLVDADELESLALPTDVIQLVVKRMGGLPEDTRQILRVAALLGASFRIDLLPAIGSVAADAVHTAVGEATQARLIERAADGAYVFVHDRVREALLSELDGSLVRTLHQRIAEALSTAGGAGADHIYALARHYARGEVERNPRRVYAANVAAGMKALENYATEEAYTFLDLAYTTAQNANILPDTAVVEALGNLCARSGRLAEAVSYLEQAIGRAGDRLRRAELRRELSHVHLVNYDSVRAGIELEQAFAEIGIAAPRTRIVQVIVTLGLWVLGWLAERFGWRFGTAQGAARELYRTQVQLYENVTMIAYFDMRFLTMLQAAARLLYPAHMLGPSRELAIAYSYHAFILGSLQRRKTADAFARKAIQIAEQLDDRPLLARGLLFQSLSMHLSGASREAELLSRRCIEEYGRWMDAQDYVNACADLAWNLIVRGYFREAWGWAERALVRLRYQSRYTNDRIQEHPTLLATGVILAAIGKPTEAFEYLRRSQEIIGDIPQENFSWASLQLYSALFYFEQGDLGNALEQVIGRFRALGLNPRLASFHLRHFYVIQAYAYLARSMAVLPEERQAQLNELRRALGELKCAAVIPALRCHYLALAGAYERLCGRNDRALTLLVQAAITAREADSPWALYEIARQGAHILLAQGNQAAALREARVAYNLAIEHGWASRARQVRVEFRIVDTLHKSASNGALELPPGMVLGGDARKLRRHLDALLQVSLASSVVFDPDQQARTVLDRIIQLLGAERAFLFLCVEGSQSLSLYVGRDAAGHDLTELTGYSSTVVERTRVERQPLVVSGTEQGIVLGSESIVARDLRSILAAPLLLHDRLIGVVYLDNRLARGIFTSDDVDILLSLAQYIPIALEAARTARLEIRYQSERQRRKLEETLRVVTSALNSTLDLSEVLDRLLKSMAQIVPYDGAAVILRHGEHFDVMAARELPGTGVRPDRDERFAEIIRTRQPLLIGDIADDPRLGDSGDAARIQSWLGVPLISRGEVVGILTLESHTTGAYNQRAAEVAFTFAGQAAIAIENARLFGEVQRLATTDGLTGIYNRRHFFILAEHEVQRARRARHSMGVIMVDVDHFKRVNDSHGHAAGDQVLRSVAERCQQNIRAVDILGRYGGEEFAILLPEADMAIALAVAERLRQCVASAPVSVDGHAISVTLSLGVAVLTDEGDDLEAVLYRADAALYAAKQAGRNRVVLGGS